MIRIGSHNWRGSALVVAMSMMLMLSMLGVSVLNTTLSSNRMAVHRRDREAAFEIAEAGLAHAIRQLQKKDGRTYAGEGPVQFGAGTFRIEVTTPPDMLSRRRVISYGQVTSLGDAPLEQRVGAMVDLQSPVWTYSILTEKDMSLEGELRTDSTPITARGDVHSNQDLTITNGVTVDGRASAVGTTTVSSATVTGGTRSGSDKVPLPKFNKSAVRAEAEAQGVTYGDMAFSSGTRVLGGVIVGNLTVESTARLVVDRVLWVTGTLRLAGQSYGGDGLLVAEGAVYLAGGTGFTGSETNHLAIVGLANDSTKPDKTKVPALTIEGKAQVRGGILAPNGTVAFSGEGRVWGSIASRELAAAGKAHVTCINNFEAPPQLDDPGVRSWEEL